MTDRTNQKLLEENSFLKQRIQDLEQSETGRKEAEDLLKLEHELYLDMLKYQPAGIYRLRVFPSNQFPKDAWRSLEYPPYILEAVNDRFCEILEIDRKIFKTNPNIVTEMVHTEDKEEFIRRNEEANAKLIPFMWEGRLSIGEKICWVHFESLPRPIANGNVLWTGFLYDITVRKKQEEEMKALISKLNKALEEIKTLKGIVPICVSCKKIRDDKGYWNQIESYISQHSEAKFSHGICPECAEKLYPDMNPYKK